MLNAGMIFDNDTAKYTEMVRDLESIEEFYNKYIEVTYEKNKNEGYEFEIDYRTATVKYLRNGFIIGFNAAVQLLMSCMAGAEPKE